jgi:hypothetical protein
MDIVDDIMTHVEACLIYWNIVFSLHLGEPLVLDLAMLAYIHCVSPQLSIDCF